MHLRRALETGADPASRDALALLLRIRGLSLVTRGHLSLADRAPLPGLTLSERGLDFMIAAGERTTKLIDAA